MTLKLYSTELKIYATMYIVAETPEEALEIAQAQAGKGLDLPEGYAGDDLEIYGGTFHDEMPDRSLSPAMTIALMEEQELSLEELDDL